jgi:hypothetical protein
MAERYSCLRAVVFEDTDSKAETIQGMLEAGGVNYLGRVASMGAARAALQEHKSSEGAKGILAEGNLFFVDGNLSSSSSNGRDGNGILVALAEKGIALPASYWDTHRGESIPAHGIVFGCSRDIGDAGYGRAMLDYNLYVNVPDAEAELRRMLDLAVELLPATA